MLAHDSRLTELGSRQAEAVRVRGDACASTRREHQSESKPGDNPNVYVLIPFPPLPALTEGRIAAEHESHMCGIRSARSARPAFWPSIASSTRSAASIPAITKPSEASSIGARRSAGTRAGRTKATVAAPAKAPAAAGSNELQTRIAKSLHASTPTLDNGRRSPRKLLRAVVARLLGRKALPLREGKRESA
jgi:hypothetical protein